MLIRNFVVAAALLIAAGSTAYAQKGGC